MHTVIVPVNQLNNGPIPAPMMPIEIKPFLHLTVSLRMIHPAKKLLDAFCPQKVLKRVASMAMFVSAHSIKLHSMITDAFPDAQIISEPATLQSLL